MRENMSRYSYRISYPLKTKETKYKKISKLALRILLILVILLPYVGCLISSVKIKKLNRAMEEMSAQLDSISQTYSRQQELLESWLSESAQIGQGEAVPGKSELERMQEAVGIFKDVDMTQQAAGIQEVSGQQTVKAEPLHKVYLTFDDGPSSYTEKILEILDRYQVKATFFVVGKSDAASEDMLRRIVEDGHTLGLHSYSHDYAQLYHSVESFSADFERQQDYVYEVTGHRSLVYRFPGGSSNTISDVDMKEFAEYLTSQGVEFYDWNVSSGDGSSRLPDVDTLVKNCTQGITDRGTSIILMHDSPEKITTLEALPLVIEKILAMEDTVILPITSDTYPVHHNLDLMVKEGQDGN